MYVVHPEEIASYIACPLRYKLSREFKKTDVLLSIFTRTIKQVYLKQMKSRSVPSWASIPKWLDREIKLVCKTKDEVESCLSLLQSLYRWYHHFYLKAAVDAACNVPIIFDIYPGITYYDIIDVVEMYKRIVIVDTASISAHDDVNSTLLYRDTLTHVRTWGFAQAMGMTPRIYKRYYLTTGSMNKTSYFVREEAVERMQKTVEHAVSGIILGVFNPSISEQCDQCDFITECSF